MYFKSRKSIGSWLGTAEARHGGGLCGQGHSQKCASGCKGDLVIELSPCLASGLGKEGDLHCLARCELGHKLWEEGLVL